MELRQVAEVLGFIARAVQATSELINRLNEALFPAIIHWRGYRWNVLGVTPVKRLKWRLR